MAMTRCTLAPSSGLRVLADGFTVMHVSPGSVRPLTAHLGSSLRAIGGHFEVRVLASPKNVIKIGLFDPSVVAARCRTAPFTEDVCVSLSADTGVLVIKTKDGSRRAAATTFGAGDTVGMGVECNQKSPGTTRHVVQITRNGRMVDSFQLPPTLQSPMDLHPVVVLSVPGDLVCLDVLCDRSATCKLPPYSPSQSGRAVGSSSSSLSPAAGRAKNVSSLLIFRDKEFRKHRVSSHLTVQKVTKTSIGAVHVKKDLWSMRTPDTADHSFQTCYFEVTFSLPVPAEKESGPVRGGMRGRNSLCRTDSEASLFSVSSFNSTE